MRSREYLTPAEVENNSAHALLRASAQRQPLDQLIDRLGMPAAAAWCRDLAPGQLGGHAAQRQPLRLELGQYRR